MYKKCMIYSTNIIFLFKTWKNKVTHTLMCKIILRKRSLVDNNMKTTS